MDFARATLAINLSGAFRSPDAGPFSLEEIHRQVVAEVSAALSLDDYLLTRAEVEGEHIIEGPLTSLLPHERAVILPPPALAGVFELGDDHPLNGVPYFSVIDVMKLLGALLDTDPEQARQILGLLELCREQRVALSWRREDSPQESSQARARLSV